MTSCRTFCVIFSGNGDSQASLVGYVCWCHVVCNKIIPVVVCSEPEEPAVNPDWFISIQSALSTDFHALFRPAGQLGEDIPWVSRYHWLMVSLQPGLLRTFPPGMMGNDHKSSIDSMAISGTDWLEVPTIYKAYCSGLCKGISPQFIWPYMVLTYLHFRILKFPLINGQIPLLDWMTGWPEAINGHGSNGNKLFV
jgi:hypothetical protein